MKLFTCTALALLTANTAAANDDAGALRGPSLVTADLVYVAADDADVDASSSHQIDDIANQAHIADEVSAHYYLELCRPHMVVRYSYHFSHTLVCVCVRTLFFPG